MSRWKRYYIAAALFAGIVLLLGGASGGAVEICLRGSGACPGHLELNPQGVRISPRKLSKRKPVPIEFSGGARISTSEGSGPLPLREAELRVDRGVVVDALGLPACDYRTVASGNSENVKTACRKAIVGSGTALIELAYPENAPIRVETELMLFNGGTSGGKTTLLVRGFVSIPRPHAVVARVSIERQIQGSLGSRFDVEIPKLGDGYGSLVEVDLTAGRVFAASGRRKSYLSARCPRGRLHLEITKAVFKNDASRSGWAPTTTLRGGLSVPCRPSN